MIQVREAVLDDASSINAISTTLGYKSVADEEAGNRLAALINSDSHVVWVLEKQGQVVGWLHAVVSLRVASEPFAEIAGLAVCSSFRRQGIGQNLVEYAQRWAQCRDLNLRVRCNLLRVDSHKFYEAVGFEKIKGQDVFELTATF